MNNVIDLLREFGVPDHDLDEVSGTIDVVASMLNDKCTQAVEHQMDVFLSDVYESDFADMLTSVNAMGAEYIYPKNSDRIFHWDCIVFTAMYRCGICSESECRKQLKVIIDHERYMAEGREYIRMCTRNYNIGTWIMMVVIAYSIGLTIHIAMNLLGCN